MLRFVLLASLFALLKPAVGAADLAIKVVVNQPNAVRGDTIPAIIKIENQGKTAVSDIEVQINFSEGLTLVLTDKEHGSFDPKTGIWHLKNLDERSNGTSLLALLLVEGEGPLGIQAEIVGLREKDSDSTPGNTKMGEDDLDFGYITVPIVYCGSDSIKLSAEAYPGFKNYQWLRDGKILVGETNQQLKITKVGKYTCRADGTGEDASFPVIVRRAAALHASVEGERRACAGETLKLRAQVSDGTPPYRYRWSRGDGLPLSKPLKTGEKLTLRVTITDREGCLVKTEGRVVVENCLKE